MLPVEQEFLDGLHDHGYIEGRNVVIEVRSAGGRPERFAEIATELVRLPVDVLLVGVCGAPLDAARSATQTIPIVVATCNDDLVETGIVNSLARPGGNVTGLSKLTPELAAASRLPALYAFREVPDAGGLMSYGPNIRAMWRRAAAYVVKILQGAKAGDLPIEQPTKFEFVINLKTAKALGLTIPQSLLLRADDVIQ